MFKIIVNKQQEQDLTPEFMKPSDDQEAPKEAINLLDELEMILKQQELEE